MTPRRVFVTGARGFVGSEVVNQLLARGMSVVALSRNWAGQSERPGLKLITAPLLGGDSWSEHLVGCDAVIHLVGIIRENPARGETFGAAHIESTRRVIAAMRQAGISRYIHMSAIGTRPLADSLYHRSKALGEEEVTGSKLAWTIFRPSMIHGPSGEFSQLMARWASKTPPVMPYFARGVFGSHAAGLQPIYVVDVARAFVEALGIPAAVGKTYDLVGPELLPWPAFYRVFAAAIGRPKAMPLAVPAWFARLILSVIPEKILPFTRDQLIMSLEGHAGDPGALLADFGWKPRSFRDSLREYAGRLAATA